MRRTETELSSETKHLSKIEVKPTGTRSEIELEPRWSRKGTKVSSKQNPGRIKMKQNETGLIMQSEIDDGLLCSRVVGDFTAYKS